jgi:hypothetical protein
MSLKRHKYAVDAQGFDEIKRIFNSTKENFYLGFCKCYFLTTPNEGARLRKVFLINRAIKVFYISNLKLFSITNYNQ